VSTAATRGIDVLVAGIALVLLSPLALVVALLCATQLGRPVLFRQARPGLGGRSIEIVKFRSMRDANDSNGHPLPDDERLTPFGKLLRRSSLDEIPQLWSVLKGDLSLVGPRPLLMEYLSLYTPFQMRRHEVRPGITGWAQVNGRNAIDWDRKFELDVWYVDNRSLWLDIKILLLTVAKVVRGDGISSRGSVTMPAFTGSTEAKIVRASDFEEHIVAH
jgi:lipopolysaccharide/colanic/teichoic acid biosynthesis glycosyltransferase